MAPTIPVRPPIDVNVVGGSLGDLSDAVFGSLGAAIDQLVAKLEEDYPDRSKALASTFAISSTSAQSAQLPVGDYEMWADVDCHFRQGATGGTAVTSDRWMGQGQHIKFSVINTVTAGYIQVVTEDPDEDGYVWIERVGVSVGQGVQAGYTTLGKTTKAATVTPGVVSMAAGYAAVSKTTRAATITPGAISVAAGYATVSKVTRAATVTPGAVSSAAGYATMGRGTQAATVTPGAVLAYTADVTIGKTTKAATVTQS